MSEGKTGQRTRRNAAGVYYPAQVLAAAHSVSGTNVGVALVSVSLRKKAGALAHW